MASVTEEKGELHKAEPQTAQWESFGMEFYLSSSTTLGKLTSLRFAKWRLWNSQNIRRVKWPLVTVPAPFPSFSVLDRSPGHRGLLPWANKLSFIQWPLVSSQCALHTLINEVLKGTLALERTRGRKLLDTCIRNSCVSDKKIIQNTSYKQERSHLCN